MAKKSKRQQARKQRPQQRPQPAVPARFGAPPAAPPDVLDSAADDVDDVAEQDDDYATGSLPLPESDGPLPLPPPDPGGEEPELPGAAAAQSRSEVAAATATSERRRVGRIDPNAVAPQQRPGQRARGRTTATAAMFEPLPPEDAAIPFDRVPYVPADLRRVLIIAGLMVVLVVAANFVVNAVVK